MSTHHTSNPGNGASSNNNSLVSRREVRANNMTGALPSLGPVEIERSHPGTFNFEQMLQSLHEQFAHDRQVASQPDSTRCGICYLHFPVNELHYRDEGFYACYGCERALGKQTLPMVRKQQKI